MKLSSPLTLILSGVKRVGVFHVISNGLNMAKTLNLMTLIMGGRRLATFMAKRHMTVGLQGMSKTITP